MSEKQPPIKDKSSAVIYLYASNRRDKIIPALTKHFVIVDAKPILPKGFVLAKAFKVLAKLLRSYPVLRRLRRDNKSVIVMVDSYSFDDLAIGIIAKFLHLPLFIRLRGGMWRELNDRWQSKPFPIRQLYTAYRHFCRDQILLMADGIITVSYFLRNQIIYHFNKNIDFGKIKTVYNPVNFTAFDEVKEGNFRKKLGMIEGDRIILTVTSFDAYKKYTGIAYYLPAILRVLDENDDWYFAIAGRGCSFKRVRKSILEITPENLKERIIFTGYYKPIEEALKDSDIVVHLAFRETAPNVVLEAQAAGKPTICNYFGGSPELLQNWHDNPCCVIKEVTELHESLKVLVNSSELRKSVGRKNRQAVEKEFTYENIGDDFYLCINSILGRNTHS